LISSADSQNQKAYLTFDALNKILTNVGGVSVNHDAFKSAYDSNPAIKKMIKNFDKSGITLDTDAESPDLPTKKGARGSSLSTMAKRATKKRQ
jgi:hypothetical protein